MKPCVPYMIIHVVLFVFVTAGCGSPRNAPVAKSLLPVPEILKNPDHSDGHINLIDQLLKKHEHAVFTGHFLLWHSEAKSEDMALVASSTASSRLAKAQVLAQQEQLRSLEQKILKESRAAAQQDRIPVSPALAADLQQKLSGWVERTLVELQGQGHVTESQTEKTLEKLKLYCEFKVWELATSDYIQDAMRAPLIPALSCQKIYQGSALKDCGQMAVEEQYRCLWERGVLSSRRFQQSATEPCRGQEDLTRRDAVQGWIKSGVLQQALQSDLKVSDFSDELVRVKLKQAIMGGRPLLTAITQHFPELAECKDAFMSEDIQTFADARLMFENDDYISMLELRETSEQQQILIAVLLEPLRALDGRQAFSQGDMSNALGDLLSVSDRLVNLISINEQRHTDKEAELFARHWLAEQEVIPAAHSDQSSDEHTVLLRTLQKQKLRLQAQLSDAHQDMLESLSLQLTSALRPRTAIAFWPLNIVFSMDSGTGEVTAKLAGGDYQSDRQDSQSDILVSEEQYRGFKLTLSHLDAQPLGFMSSSQNGTDRTSGEALDQFSDLEAVPKDATLVMNLYLQNVGVTESLTFLSGKTYLMHGDSVLAEGVVGIDMFNALSGF